MPRPRIELEDPAGDVVEKIAIVRDGDDGGRDNPSGSARARRPTRRRGGWSGSSSSSRSGDCSRSRHSANAAALAAGQRSDLRLGRRQPQRVHRELESRVEIQAFRRIESCPGCAACSSKTFFHVVRRQDPRRASRSPRRTGPAAPDAATLPRRCEHRLRGIRCGHL